MYSTSQDSVSCEDSPRREQVAIMTRSEETESLLQSVIPEIKNFLQVGDEQQQSSTLDGSSNESTLLVHPAATHPDILKTELGSSLVLKEQGVGPSGLQNIIRDIFKYSVNTNAPGFLDKLYAAPLPPGIVGDLVLSVLNTNVHVFQVSPILTLIEKEVTSSLAKLFGLNEPRSGGISTQGGSASNLTSIVVARNTLFPKTKTEGNKAVKEELVLLTSAHGHYSIEKAAQALGFGSGSVISVPVDADGKMIPSELENLIKIAQDRGHRPFYVNATAGSTVLGSFDPFNEIAEIASRYRLWLHVDAAWGGSFVFSSRKDLKDKLKGVEKADSIATNPHKMLGVPVTCSFLLGKDMRQFETANTLKAGYLFHDKDEYSDEDEEDKPLADTQAGEKAFPSLNKHGTQENTAPWIEPYDLADLSLQCGRRGDSLKFFLSCQYYGMQGYSEKVDTAYELACFLSKQVDRHSDLLPVLKPEQQPSCLQVCFYFAPGGKFTYGLCNQEGHVEVPHRKAKFPNNVAAQQSRKKRLGRLNSRVTASITQRLIAKGFMIDFAPALEGQEDRGSFFRVVVNISTLQFTIERLLVELIDVGYVELQQIEQQGCHRGSGV